MLLTLIFAFAFVYRVILMLLERFPPGADIGLHNSIIASITQGGNTNFLWNNYHMGGGSSVTFPGYHIFTSYVILLTGLPDYVSHALVVSLFSALIVVAAYLIMRKVWNPSAALIVAFLVAVSRFDIEMLMWGGYPNVITLLLIPLAFLLFLEREKLGLAPFVISASLVCGGLFLTHSLSSVLFIAIVLTTVFLGVVFAKRTSERRLGLLIWILPLVLGAVSIAPFLIQVAPAYLGSDVGTFTGGVVDIRSALLSTKLLPLEIVVPLFIFVFLYFAFSKYYNGKALTVPMVLLVLWWLIPTIMTQGYLVGLYTDFQRFLYFVILPVIMLVGLGFYHSARFFAQASDWLVARLKETPFVRMGKSKALNRLMPHMEHKNFLLIFILSLVLFTFLFVSMFAPPNQGVAIQSFYQLMNQPKYEALQWAQQNTPPNALFLTDAQYGWWFGGFAKRPTISAVEPQYLTNEREFEPAKVARYMLDTDYLVDNGLIQVREDGGYIARHNPEFLIKLTDEYFPYPFFNFDNSKTLISLRAGDPQLPLKMDLAQVPVSDMHIKNENDTVSIYVTHQNLYFNFTQKTVISQGVRFANMTQTLTTDNPTVTFDGIAFTMPTKGTYAQIGNGSIVGEFDNYIYLGGPPVFVAGQIIFTEGQPFVTDLTGYLVMDYNLAAKSNATVAFSLGVYQYEPSEELKRTPLTDVTWNELYEKLLSDHAGNYTEQEDSDLPIDVFDYRQALSEQKVSYIALRDPEQIPRLAKDPNFSLVFINDEVSIFRVRK